MAKPKVFATHGLFEPARQILEESCDVEYWAQAERPPRPDLMQRVKDKEGLVCLLTEKVSEELLEVDEAIQGGDKQRVEEELGDLLFSLVNLARHHGVDAELALRNTSDRFARRFAPGELRGRDLLVPQLHRALDRLVVARASILQRPRRGAELKNNRNRRPGPMRAVSDVRVSQRAARNNVSGEDDEKRANLRACVTARQACCESQP